MPRSDIGVTLGTVPFLTPAVNELKIFIGLQFQTYFVSLQPPNGTATNIAEMIGVLAAPLTQTIAAVGAIPEQKTSIATLVANMGGHLGARLLHRAVQLEIADKLVEAVKFQGEYIGERLAQHLQFQEGKDSISLSGIPEVLPVQKNLDIDTGGTLPP